MSISRATRCRMKRPSGRRSAAGRICSSWRPDGKFPRLLRPVWIYRPRPAEESRRAFGGERNRVHLARLLKTGANVILLDEPTQRPRCEFHPRFGGRAGDVCRLCGDRRPRPLVLDRVATHILAFEGDSQVHWFPGNYSAYLEDFRRRKGTTPTVPTGSNTVISRGGEPGLSRGGALVAF